MSLLFSRLYAAYACKCDIGFLSVFDLNLELGSAVLPDNFVVDSIHMKKSMLKIPELWILQRQRFISLYTPGPTALEHH